MTHARHNPAPSSPHLAHLLALPFIEDVVWVPSGPAVDLRSKSSTHRLEVEDMPSHLGYTAVDAIIAHRRGVGRPWILFAPYVSRVMGQYLGERGVLFVDAAGNCRVVLDQERVALIEGRPKPKASRGGRGLGVSGYQVIFALLADSDLLSQTVRSIAHAAGVSKTAVAEGLARLQADGDLAITQGGRQLIDPERLLRRWVGGYAELVRPRLLLGTWRTLDTPTDLERRLEATLDPAMAWALSGSAASFRLVGHYRGEKTVLVVPDGAEVLRVQLGALADPRGPLIVMRSPGPLSLKGPLPHTAHPLLVYAELLASRDERDQEAAEMLRTKLL